MLFFNIQTHSYIIEDEQADIINVGKLKEICGGDNKFNQNLSQLEGQIINCHNIEDRDKNENEDDNVIYISEDGDVILEIKI